MVLHLAALIAIPYSYVAPRSYVETNVTGTLNVLEAVRRHGTPRMVNTSTSRGLRHARDRADHRGAPAARPVALLGDEDRRRQDVRVVRAVLRHAGDDPAAVQHLRSAAVGARRHPDRAVPAARRGHASCGSARSTPKRDFTFVTDTATGFVRAAVADLEPGHDVQLGTGRTVSIGEIVEHVPHASPASTPRS